MSFRSFFTKNTNSSKGKKCALLVDIGSAKVTTSIALFEKNVTTILAIESTDIVILSDLTYERFEKEMQKALLGSLNKILKYASAPLDFIQVCLASPWYDSQVRTAKVSRLAPFVVSKTVLDDMVKRELKAFEEEEVKKKAVAGDSVRSIESQTIRVRLNGYETHEPIGLSAKELELTMFLSIASERTIKSVEDVIHRVYNAPIKFSTFLSMTYLVARDFFPHKEDYMLVDVGGEVADISFVKQNGLQQAFSFPYGKNFILRRLSLGLGRTIEEAQTLWTLHVEGKTTGEVAESCQRILSAARLEWQESFQKALYSASRDLSVPDTILLTIDDDVAFWFSDAIKNEQFHQNTLLGKEFRIFFMNSTLFKDALAFAPKVERNSSVMIEAIGVRYLFSIPK